MKGKIRQYRPAYVSGFETQINNFNSIEELLNIDWVKSFAENKNFFKYSIALAENYESEHTLMAEYKNGFEWWVIGFIDKNTKIKGIELFDKD